MYVIYIYIYNKTTKNEKTTRILIKVLQNHRGGCMVWRHFSENPWSKRKKRMCITPPDPDQGPSVSLSLVGLFLKN